MAKKSNDELRTERQIDKLEWENAKELGLEGGLADTGGKLNAGKASKADSGIMRELVKEGERRLAKEGDRKAKLNLRDKL